MSVNRRIRFDGGDSEPGVDTGKLTLRMKKKTGVSRLQE